MAEAGAIEKVVLDGREVNPCKACDACSGTHVYIQKDDMALRIESMKASSVLVSRAQKVSLKICNKSLILTTNKFGL